MTENKPTVERYMDAFTRTDHAAILACLTDDVEWLIPGFFHVTGKDAFDGQIENEGFTGTPEITTTRLTEENDVVVAEGTVRTRKATGEALTIAFCDVFELREGKIARLTSYLVEVK
jgi:ketosteroid isomerase-like protein